MACGRSSSPSPRVEGKADSPGLPVVVESQTPPPDTLEYPVVSQLRSGWHPGRDVDPSSDSGGNRS